LNLFRPAQTHLMPGTLHHSGNRPAPPSEDIPLERRSAFLETRQPGNLAARPGLKACSERVSAVPFARRTCLSAKRAWKLEPLCSRYGSGSAPGRCAGGAGQISNSCID
jgi:hypothetical protein